LIKNASLGVYQKLEAKNIEIVAITHLQQTIYEGAACTKALLFCKFGPSDMNNNPEFRHDEHPFCV
jgi:hypothetical protein